MFAPAIVSALPCGLYHDQKRGAADMTSASSVTAAGSADTVGGEASGANAVESLQEAATVKDTSRDPEDEDVDLAAATEQVYQFTHSILYESDIRDMSSK